MRAKEKNRRRRFRENGILAVYLLRFFWFLATAKGLISWLMALWFCVSSGSLPGLAGSLFPFSRRGRGLERVNEDSIQIYLNTMTLINLNAFGVAGAYVQIYLLTSDHGWFQGYIIRTLILGICDVETEGNSVVICSWSHHVTIGPGAQPSTVIICQI